MGLQKRYRAFISYSQLDKVWGARLHRWLETYRVPPGVDVELDARRSLGRFFRDDEEMAATADIAELVRSSIDDSECLIVVCSPRSAQSRWVSAEIQYFRSTDRARKIFAFIIDGEPNSADPRAECFPPAFRTATGALHSEELPIEPLGLDVRKEGRARTCARLAAGLLGVDFDDLWQRDRRRAAARQRGVISGLAAAVIVFAVLAVAAVRFGLAAQESSRRAQAARATLLADSSTRSIADRDYAKALGYAAAALEVSRTSGDSDAMVRAERAARQALFDYHSAPVRLDVTYRGHAGRVTDVAESGNGKWLATAGDDGTARLYLRDSGTLLAEVKHPDPVASVFFIAEDRYLVSASRDGTLKATPTGTPGREIQASMGTGLRGARAIPGSDAVIAWGLTAKVAIWRPLEEKLDKVVLDSQSPIRSVEFLPGDGDLVFLDLSTLGSVIAWREHRHVRTIRGITGGREIARGLVSFVRNAGFTLVDVTDGRVPCKIDDSNIVDAAVDIARDRIILRHLPRSSTSIEFWSLSRCSRLAGHKVNGVTNPIVAASAQGKAVAWTEQKQATVFDTVTGQLLFNIEPPFAIAGVDVSDTAGRVLMWSRDGRGAVWSLSDGKQLKSLDGGSAIREARFSKTGKTVWLARDPGELQIVALENGGLEGSLFHGDAVLGWHQTSEDGGAVSWSADGTARHWSWLPSPIGYLINPTGVNTDAVAVNETAGRVVAAGAAGISAHDLQSGKVLAHASFGTRASGVVLSNDGKAAVLVPLQGRARCVWSIERSEGTCHEFQEFTRPIAFGTNLFAFHARDKHQVKAIDSTRIAEAPLDIGRDVTAVVQVGKTHALAVCLKGGEIALYSSGIHEPDVQFRVDGGIEACSGVEDRNRIVVVTAEGKLTVIDLNDQLDAVAKRWVATVAVPTKEIGRLDQIHAGRHIVFAGTAGRLIWLDPDARRVLRDTNLGQTLVMPKVSEDLQTLGAPTNTKGVALLLDRQGGEPRELRHRSNVLGLRFIAGGQKVVTWSSDRTVKIWSSNGLLEHELPHFGIAQDVATSPDHRILVTWTDRRELAYWDVETGAKLLEMQMPDVPNGVRFDDRQRMLVTSQRIGPLFFPYYTRESLGRSAGELLTHLNPFDGSEQCALQPDAASCQSAPPGRRVGSTSLAAGDDFLINENVNIELGLLADGGLLIAGDRPFKILQGVEYNEFDQLMTLYAVDETRAIMAHPISADIADAIRRQRTILIYTVFPNEAPVGYQVPLAVY